ncbi:MAG TPA: response regulator [Candidatus Acidoferrales bacterium]|jgi:CheY-like chemotaxis protein
MAATILLVDSDLIDRADWQALLQFHGYKVFTAPNGKAALDCFPYVQPDLVLMDSGLADISSDEVCRRLKADRRAGDTPIIVVGSYLSRLKNWQTLEENPSDSPNNPATREQALDRIHGLLSSGQFHLFSESPENAHDCPECSKRLTPPVSMQFDG